MKDFLLSSAHVMRRAFAGVFLFSISFLFLGLPLSQAAISGSFTDTQTQANIAETKASVTLTVGALPADTENITIGSCLVTFTDGAGVGDNSGATDEVDCGDNAATINNYTLANPGVARTAAQIADVIDSLTNVSDAAHGTLSVAAGGATDTVFTTAGTETSATNITFTDGTGGDITSGSVVTGVVPVAQVVDFTPATITDGETWRATIDGTDYDHTVSGAETVQNVVEALQPLMDGNGAVTCTEDDTKVTCTAAVAGTAFTHAATVVDITLPTLDPVSIASDNANDTTLAMSGDTITLTFTASETLTADPTVTIDGNAATVVNGAAPLYTASYTLSGGDTEGVATFTIDFTDTNSNAGTQVTATTDASNVTIDETAPVFVSAEAVDDTTVEVTFDDTVSYIANLSGSDFTATGITVTAASINGGDDSIVDLTVNSLGDTAFTASDLAIAVSAVEDMAGNASASSSGSAIADGQTPTIIETFTDDTDGNGKIDEISILFSETMDATITSVAPVTVTGYTILGFDFWDSDAVTDDLLVIDLNENGNTCDLDDQTGCDTGATPNVTVTAGTYADLAANTSGGISAAATDEAIPIIVDAETLDNTGNGQIDAIEVQFSEDLNGTSVNNDGSDFTVAGYTVTAAAELTGLVTLTLTESGSDDTAATPLVSLVSNVNDLASPSNQNSSDSITPTDGAAPFIDTEVAVTDPTNDQTPTWGFDSSEAGTIAYSGDCSSATTAATQGTQTVDFNTLAEGTHSNCSIIVTDSSSNASSSFNVTAFEIDITAPTVALTYSADPAKAGTVTVTATYSENVTSAPNFTVNQPGTTDVVGAAATTGVAPTNVFTYDYTVNTDDGSNYVDGTTTVSLSATADTATNASSLPTNDSFTIDTTPPATPVSAPDMEALTDLGESDTDNLTSDNTPDFTMSCTIGNTVEIFAAATSKGTASCTTGTVTITSAIIPSATYSMTYTETDAAGNVSGSSPGLSVTVDTTAPTVTSITGDTDPIYSGDLTQTVTVVYSESMDTAVTPTFGTAGYFSAGSGAWSTTTNTDDTYTITFTHDGSSMNLNDQINVLAGAADEAGNTDATGAATSTFLIDTQVPTLQSFTSSTGDNTYGPTSTVNVTATYDENVTGTITVDLNNTVTGVALTCAGATTCTGTYTVGATGSGEDIAAVDVSSIASESVTDDNGNAQTGSSMPATTIATASTIVIDTTAPTLQSFTSSTGDDTYGPTSAVNVTATYDENIGGGSTITVVLDNGETVALSTVSGMTISGTYTVGATGSGQDSSDLTVASITSQAAADTAATSANTQTGTSLPATNIADGSDIVIDTTAPATPSTAADMEAASDLGESDTDDVTSDNTPDFSGVCTDGNTVTLYVDNVKSTDTLLCASSVFTITSSAIADGGHTVTFTETDAVGNESAETTSSLAITIDTDAPDVTVNQKGSQADPTNASPVLFTVIFDEDMDVATVAATDFTIAGTATVGTATLSNSDAQNFELSVPVTADGTVIVSLAGSTAADKAGNNNNASTSTDNTVTVDTVAPTLTSVSIISDNGLDTSLAKVADTITVTFTADEALTATPTATIAGQAATVTNTVGNTYTATHVVTGGDTEGAAAVTIDFTDLAGNAGTQVTATTDASSVTIDVTAPTFSSGEVANGTPTQLSATFSEAIIVADSTGFGIKAAGLDRAVNSAVGGSTTTNITYTLTSDVFEAGQAVTIRYTPGAVTDMAGNIMAAFGEQSVTNNIVEGSPILSDILLTSSTANPSSAADITWDTQDNVNGVGTGTLNTTSNEVEYGTSMTLGSTQATSTGDGVSSHSASLSGLSANTVYYYRVKSVANGKTSYSQIFSFTTARGDNGLYVDNLVNVKTTGAYDATNPYTNGWHFRFETTADSISEQYLRMKIDNWTNGTTPFTTSGNVKMLISSAGQSGAAEGTIAAGTGIETTYDAGTTVDISGISDNDPNQAGKQFVVDVYVQIPSGSSGSYSASYYGIANQAADSGWSVLD